MEEECSTTRKAGAALEAGRSTCLREGSEQAGAYQEEHTLIQTCTCKIVLMLFVYERWCAKGKPGLLLLPKATELDDQKTLWLSEKGRQRTL